MIRRWGMVLGGGIWGVDLKVVVMAVMMVMAMGHDHQSWRIKESRPMGGPYVGLVMAYPTEEKALVDSGLFLPSCNTPYVDLAGRRFHIGKIKSVDVIYVMTGEQILNAGITVQIMVDTFEIRGIVHYGTAGSANDSLSFGDVSILKYVAFTSSWKWKEFKSGKGELQELEFGEYNYPEQGENLLGKIEFTPTELYSIGKSMQQIFWLPIHPLWFNIASQLQDLELKHCVNETYCLPKKPKVVYGLKGSTADVYLDNAAYRQFLFNQFDVSTVDEESAAVVMTCLSNGIASVVFRGVSDLAGGSNLLDASLSSLASINALTVAVAFLELIGNNNAML